MRANAARPLIEKLGPRVLVELFVVAEARELRLQHRENRLAVGEVLAFEVNGLSGRQRVATLWQSVGRVGGV